MPNWVKNNIAFSGKQEQINELLESIKTIDSDGNIDFIDFQKILPMPDSLRITSGSSTDLGLDILNYRETGDDSSLKERLGWSFAVNAGIKTVDDLIDHCIKNGSADLISGQEALNNIKLYGFKDWYSWSVSNWGTKWSASGSFMEGDILVFETAWSVPEPVLVKLSEMFPEVVLHVVYADEDIGSNSGEFELRNGVLDNYREYDGPEACEVWGYDPAEFFPDILRDRKIDQLLNRNDDNI